MFSILQTECEEWIKTANMLIQEAGGESDLIPATSEQASIMLTDPTSSTTTNTVDQPANVSTLSGTQYLIKTRTCSGYVSLLSYYSEVCDYALT